MAARRDGTQSNGGGGHTVPGTHRQRRDARLEPAALRVGRKGVHQPREVLKVLDGAVAQLIGSDESGRTGWNMRGREHGRELDRISL